jgi:[acyl-carrier-protein] S-malonyltransferase
VIAIVFPGQGSQVPGMGQNLHETHAKAREVFERASEAVGRDLADLCFHSDPDTLRQTQNAQLALYVTGLAAWLSLEEATPGLTPGAFAGHSVGEYAALAAAGVFSIEEGARLVKKRGEIMAAAGQERPGTMAAVLGMARPDLEDALADLGGPGVAVIANDNCPGQIVISGDVDAIARASAVLPEKGAKRVLELNVSGAFHSPLMEGSAKEMGEALAGCAFALGKAPVFSNVTSLPGEDWADLLERQLKSQVRWAESVLNMKESGVTEYVECGAGEVLGGMIRRLHREGTVRKVVDDATLQEASQALSS